MKTLPANQVKFDDSFLKENKDILPDGFIWFYDVVKTSRKEEYRERYPNFWFLVDRNNQCILQYNEIAQNGYIPYCYVRRFLIFDLNLTHSQIEEICEPILEHHFQCKMTIKL